MKVAIRTVISGLVGKNRKELRKEIEELEEALNEMHELKVRACAEISDRDNNEEKVNLINMAIFRIEDDLNTMF